MILVKDIKGPILSDGDAVVIANDLPVLEKASKAY
jgi:uncharacterized Zn ribbon protein